MTEAVLLAVARCFRNWLETADFANAPGSLSSFPAECCSWACYFLGAFVKEEMGLAPVRVQGARGADNHEWIQVDDFTIDITSDQFADSDARVVVATSSVWHDGWKIESTQSVSPISDYGRVARGGQRRPPKIYKLLAATARFHLT